MRKMTRKGLLILASVFVVALGRNAQVQAEGKAVFLMEEASELTGLEISAADFEVLLEDASVLTSDQAVTLANAVVTPGALRIFIMPTVNAEQLTAINNATEPAYYPLTFTGSYGDQEVETTIQVHVIMGISSGPLILNDEELARVNSVDAWWIGLGGFVLALVAGIVFVMMRKNKNE